MNHKAGDLVRIQSKDWFNKQPQGAYGWVNPSRGFENCLDADMLAHAGETAKIKHITSDGYVLDDINDCWIKGYWEDWMFDSDFSSDKEIKS